MTRDSWREVTTPDERSLVRRWTLWNVAVYGSALVIVVALAAATRSPAKISTATSPAAKLAGAAETVKLGQSQRTSAEPPSPSSVVRIR